MTAERDLDAVLAELDPLPPRRDIVRSELWATAAFTDITTSRPGGNRHVVRRAGSVAAAVALTAVIAAVVAVAFLATRGGPTAPAGPAPGVVRSLDDLHGYAAFPARIVQRSAGDWYQAAMIDVGSRRGVTRGAAVVAETDDGVVALGRVTDVFPRSAKVTWTAADGQLTGALLPATNGVPAAAIGRGHEGLRLEGLPPALSVTSGAPVITSGALRSTYRPNPRGLSFGATQEPRGLLIGTVAPGGTPRSRILMPALNPGTVVAVHVLLPGHAYTGASRVEATTMPRASSRIGRAARRVLGETPVRTTARRWSQAGLTAGEDVADLRHHGVGYQIEWFRAFARWELDDTTAHHDTAGGIYWVGSNDTVQAVYFLSDEGIALRLAHLSGKTPKYRSTEELVTLARALATDLLGRAEARAYLLPRPTP